MNSNFTDATVRFSASRDWDSQKYYSSNPLTSWNIEHGRDDA